MPFPDHIEPEWTSSKHLMDLPYGWSVSEDSAPLPDGREKKGVRLHRSNSVHIIALNEDGHLLLLREYRPFLGAYIWMIPGGKADREGDMAEAAQRELREETGFEAAEMRPFMKCYLTDSFSARNFIFVAGDLSSNPLEQDDTELIEVHAMPIEEAIEKVFSSNPVHAISATALMKYRHEHV